MQPQRCEVRVKNDQWRSQAGGHCDMCPSNWRLCPTSAGAPEKLSVPNVPLSILIANRALKVHKVVEIELRSIAICILRITMSRMLP